MGFKDFFVERVPEEKLDEECNYDVEDETIPVELDSVNTDSLIEDVYTQNELLDKSKSIFKVEDLIKRWLLKQKEHQFWLHWEFSGLQLQM